MSAAMGGTDVVMIAAGNNKGIQRLMVRPDIKTPEGIKGKKIGVTTLGSSGHLARLLILRSGQRGLSAFSRPIGSELIGLLSCQIVKS